MNKNNLVTTIDMNDKDFLIQRFFDLLKKNGDTGKVSDFSSSEWQERVTIENLQILIRNEERFLENMRNNYRLMVKELLEKEIQNTPREGIIKALIDKFLYGEDDQKTLAMFSEIFDQEGFGQGKYHKYHVPQHTREVLNIYRSFDFIPENIQLLLQETIDGLSKDVLLQLAIVFHDAGKKSQYDKTGSMKGHEKYTMSYQIDSIAKRFSLTENQKAYLGLLIEHHSSIEDDEKKLKELGIFYEETLLRLADLQGTQGDSVDGNYVKQRTEFTKQKFQEGY